MAVAAWKKICNSSLRTALDGHDEFCSLAVEVSKCADKFEKFEGTVPDEPLLESALEEDGSAEEGLTLEHIICGDKQIRTFLSVAMPRMASKNLPPLAYLFLPNEDEPLVVTFSHDRFAVLDTKGEHGSWVSKDTGRYECLSNLFDEKPEWRRYNSVSRAVVFGVGYVPRRNPFRTFSSGVGKRKRARQATKPNTFDN